MRIFLRNLALWCIIVLLLVVLFNLFNGHIIALPLSPIMRGWLPYVIFMVVYFAAVIAWQRRRVAKLTARADAIAAVAHEDAEQIIALLREIRAARGETA